MTLSGTMSFSGTICQSQENCISLRNIVSLSGTFCVSQDHYVPLRNIMYLSETMYTPLRNIVSLSETMYISLSNIVSLSGNLYLFARVSSSDHEVTPPIYLADSRTHFWTAADIHIIFPSQDQNILNGSVAVT